MASSTPLYSDWNFLEQVGHSVEKEARALGHDIAPNGLQARPDLEAAVAKFAPTSNAAAMTIKQMQDLLNKLRAKQIDELLVAMAQARPARRWPDSWQDLAVRLWVDMQAWLFDPDWGEGNERPWQAKTWGAETGRIYYHLYLNPWFQAANTTVRADAVQDLTIDLVWVVIRNASKWARAGVRSQEWWGYVQRQLQSLIRRAVHRNARKRGTQQLRDAESLRIRDRESSPQMVAMIHEHINKFMSKLKPDERKVFEMHYRKDMSVALIATSLSMAETEVNSILQNLIRRLRCMGPPDDDICR